MTKPPGFRVEVEALRADAVRWDAAAAEMDEPLRAVKTLNLNGAHDVHKIAHDKGFDSVYAETRLKFEEMLDKVHTYFRDLSGQMSVLASSYEFREATTAAGFDGLKPEVPQ